MFPQISAALKHVGTSGCNVWFYCSSQILCISYVYEVLELLRNIQRVLYGRSG